MIRRLFVALALFAPFALAPAAAADWRKDYPEINFAVVPAENEATVTSRWTPFLDYLGKELGVKISLRIANDYAAVIEGQRSGMLHLGYYGAASFSRARLTGVPTEAFALNVNKDSGKGYYSVFYVKADSAYHDMQDLKGKNLGLVDANSTSGYEVPLYTLNKMGIDPEKFFARSQITGSHQNVIFALVSGTVDVAADSWNSESYSNVTRMINRGLLKKPDGSPMSASDFRIILKSPLILNGPYTYLASLPDEMKADIRAAFFAAPIKAKDIFDRLSDGNNLPWEPIDTSAYDETIRLIQFVDSLRKRS
ncbi:MAG TPA: phosphonate ABC transporter substrate-binding protein [Stellaceae bacterium]|nr:phosphonate ABC transporter substrate-binding protein [Stellaceae bacterium]